MRKKQITRYISIFMIINILFEICSPSLAMALTNGPTQQELLGFEPANSSEMVDLFTGDFKYNIPVMEVEGYPLNLSYKAGSSMESEASWVGLGWSLNPGVLNRMMKGLPDDFNGENMHSEFKIKPFVSHGAGRTTSKWLGAHVSISLQGVGLGLGGSIGASKANILVHNNYKGYGYERGSDSHSSWNASVGPYGVFSTTGYNTNYNSQEGGTFTNTHISGKNFAGLSSPTNGTGVTKNTRTGQENTTYYASSGLSIAMFNKTKTNASSVPSGAISYSPKIPNNMTVGGESNSYRAGFWARIGYYVFNVSGGYFKGVSAFYNNISTASTKDVKSFGYLYSQNAGSDGLMDFNRFRDQSIMDETPYGSFSSSTHDIFFASAQGMSSAFRPFRSEVNIVRDPVQTATTESEHTGYELGLPTIVHYLKESTETNGAGQSSAWNTPFIETLKSAAPAPVIFPVTSGFSTTASEGFVEQTYFKEMGELTERDENYHNELYGSQLVAPILSKVGADYQAFSPIANPSRKKRDVRSKFIKSLTSVQASQYGFDKTYDLYDRNTFSVNASTKLVTPSTNPLLKDINRCYKTLATGSGTTSVNDHLSEISLTNTSGDRYIYGLPTYNLYKKAVAFNASAREEKGYLIRKKGLSFSGLDYTYNPLPVSEPGQLVQYTNNELIDNKRGLDNVLKIEETPAYASSYLLTNIVSADYVDVTGDGASYDDLGSFTKFNYCRESNYKWREPYCLDPAISGTLAGSIASYSNQANYVKGLICDELDDYAEYQYGVRENYYVHSIETKNYVAIFRTSLRADGIGVQDESGKRSAIAEQMKLDRIDLYSKNELLEKGATNAIPLKSVVFTYDYSLCPKTSNTLSGSNPSNGKLTLKKITFSYGKSNKSSLSPYEFSYADNSHTNPGEQNFPYSPKSIDRWGSYKPNSNSTTGATSGLNSVEFPYSEQNKTLADKYAAAWNLTEIKTPSGATIKVTYESDDYGYIQDKPAGQMCKIYTCAQSVSNYSVDVTSSYGSPATCNVKENPGFIVDLSSMRCGIPSTLSLIDAEKIATNLIPFSTMRNRKNSSTPARPLYFKTFIKVAGPECGAGIDKDYYDFVNGYAGMTRVKLFSAGVAGNTYTGMNAAGTSTYSCYRFAYISLDGQAAGKIVGSQQRGKTNPTVYVTTSPVCAAGIDLLRHYVPRLAYPGSEPANLGVSISNPANQLATAEAGIATAKADLEDGEAGNPGQRFLDQNYCVTLLPEKSFVRLYTVNHTKSGGGHRVKKIITEDNWASMTSGINMSGYAESSTVYGQSFDYTTMETTGSPAISSGVASYEPLTGGDENSLREPIYGVVESQFAPNDRFFQEAPLSEMLYPAPVVGYSKVTITPLADQSITNVAGNGKTIFEFYTSKDFPLSDETTEPRRETIEQIPEKATLTKFLKRLDNPDYDARKIFHLTQGNLVRFNNMHGKLKSMAVYGEGNSAAPIAQSTYFYKTDPSNPKRLASVVPVINEKNIVSLKNISSDIEVTADSRENIMKTEMDGKSKLYEWGVTIINIPLPPFVMPVPDIPTISFNSFHGSQEFGFRGASLTKVIEEYGVLEKVEINFNGRTTVSENLLWDSNTGNVVLTRTNNEFNQDEFTFNYPAYWGYKEMSSEFKREGIKLFCPSQMSLGLLNKPLDVSNGTFDYSLVSSPVIFEPGDEVLVTDVTTSVSTVVGEKFWIDKDPNSSKYILIDRAGKLMTTANYPVLDVNSNYLIQLVKANNKNNLDASMGYVTSMTMPLTTVGGSLMVNFQQANQKIIDAGAWEFCSAGTSYTDPYLTQQMGINVPLGSYGVLNVNPYISQNKGFMRPVDSYKFKTNREYGNQPDTRSDGLYTAAGTNSFTPFWRQETGNPYWVSVLSTECGRLLPESDHGNWKIFSKHNYYSPYGYPLQSDNAINVSSSQRYGFNHTLPVLQATNAKANEVGFESFEEYKQVYPYLAISSNTSSVFNNDHLGFYSQISSTVGSQPNFTNTTAHTGLYSLSYGTNQSVDLKFVTQQNYQYNTVVPGTTPLCNCRFVDVTQQNNAVKLDLKHTKTYLASMWVKGKTQATDYSGLVNFSIVQRYGPSGTTTVNASTIMTKSQIINGWQKLDYEITLSSAPNLSSYTIDIYINSGGTGGFYLDDFRLQPFNSTMTCKVYDPFQLRLCAELDDRNYATIYEYDQEGMLVRTKKETNTALYTIQESRAGQNKR